MKISHSMAPTRAWLLRPLRSASMSPACLGFQFQIKVCRTSSWPARGLSLCRPRAPLLARLSASVRVRPLFDKCVSEGRLNCKQIAARDISESRGMLDIARIMIVPLLSMCYVVYVYVVVISEIQ